MFQPLTVKLIRTKFIVNPKIPATRQKSFTARLFITFTASVWPFSTTYYFPLRSRSLLLADQTQLSSMVDRHTCK